MKKSKNPFLKQGFSWQAWDEGYNSESSQNNPYALDAQDLHDFWEQGRRARLNDVSLIPQGQYCYNIEINNVGSTYFKVCPYWSFIKQNDNKFGNCNYLNQHDSVDEDFLLWDQVKLCGENQD